MDYDDDVRQPSGWSDKGSGGGHQPKQTNPINGRVSDPDAGADLSARFMISDSGRRTSWDTGAQRDTEDGKPRYDLIPVAPLTRLAMHYGAGAKKYNEFNWTKGIPSSRFYSSALRHLFQWAMGDRDEDHLAAVVFNVFGLMFNEDVRPESVDWKLKAIKGEKPSIAELTSKEGGE